MTAIATIEMAMDVKSILRGSICGMSASDEQVAAALAVAGDALGASDMLKAIDAERAAKAALAVVAGVFGAPANFNAPAHSRAFSQQDCGLSKMV